MYFSVGSRILVAFPLEGISTSHNNIVVESHFGTRMKTIPCVLAAVVVFFVMGVLDSSAMVAESDSMEVQYERAIQLMDEGKFEESRTILRSMNAHLPDNPHLTYEYALSFMRERVFDSACIYFAQVIKSPEATDQYYAAYVSTLDDAGRAAETGPVLTKGYELFPRSYHLLHAHGVMLNRQKQYDSAIARFQKALSIKPDFAPSYLQCAIAQFLIGENTFWGMFEGEIFMNLEPYSERSRNFGRTLVEVMLKNYVITDTSMFVTFCADAAQDDDGTTRIHRKSKHAQPYGLRGYELPMLYAGRGARKMDFNTLVYIRINFLKYYDSLEVEKEYGQNVLVSYWRQLRDADLFPMYQLWILESIDPEGIGQIIERYKEDYERFHAWRKEHPLTITADNVFLRAAFD